MGPLMWFFFWYFIATAVALLIFIAVINLGKHRVFCGYCGSEITDDLGHGCRGLREARGRAIKEAKENSDREARLNHARKNARRN